MEKYKVLLNTIGKMYPKKRFTFDEHGIKFEKQFYIDELLEIFDRFNEACDGKETSEESSNCIKPAVMLSLPEVKTTGNPNYGKDSFGNCTYINKRK